MLEERFQILLEYLLHSRLLIGQLRKELIQSHKHLSCFRIIRKVHGATEFNIIIDDFENPLIHLKIPDEDLLLLTRSLQLLE